MPAQPLVTCSSKSWAEQSAHPKFEVPGGDGTTTSRSFSPSLMTPDIREPGARRPWFCFHERKAANGGCRAYPQSELRTAREKQRPFRA